LKKLCRSAEGALPFTEVEPPPLSSERTEALFLKGFPMKIYPVIHVECESQTLRNARLIVEAGCEGFFLINGGRNLSLIYKAVRQMYPNKFIGVNILGEPLNRLASAVIAYRGISGVWTDQFPDPESEFSRVRNRLEDKPKWFASVCFKTQNEVPFDKIREHVERANPVPDVLVTSGPGTGRAADPRRVEEIKKWAIKPIGLASGVSPENVKSYKGLVDYVLVATGISKSWTEIDPEKLDCLMENVRK